MSDRFLNGDRVRSSRGCRVAAERGEYPEGIVIGKGWWRDYATLRIRKDNGREVNILEKNAGLLARRYNNAKRIYKFTQKYIVHDNMMIMLGDPELVIEEVL